MLLQSETKIEPDLRLPIRPVGSYFYCELSVWSSVWMNFNRVTVTLQHTNEFITIIIIIIIIIIFCYLMVSVITMCNLLKYSWKRCSWTDENKRHVQAIKIAREQYNTIQYKFYCQLPMGAFQRQVLIVQVIKKKKSITNWLSTNY